MIVEIFSGNLLYSYFAIDSFATQAHALSVSVEQTSLNHITFEKLQYMWLNTINDKLTVKYF